MKVSGSRDGGPKAVQVPRALLWGLVAVALVGALATASLLGRLSAGSPVPLTAPVPLAGAPDATGSTPTAPGPPVFAEAVEGSVPTPESPSPGAEPRGWLAPSAAVPVGASGSTPSPTDEERRWVQRYFTELDALLPGQSFSGDPQALAQKLLQQATGGDTSGLDALFAAQAAAARALRGLDAPPPCHEHHRRTLALAEKTLDLGRKVQAGLTGGDAAPLLQLASLGREAEQEARELLVLDRRLRQAYGVPTPP